MKNMIIILILLFLIACNDNDNEYIPIYQDAIYIMNADGSNKQKVINVNNCDNVQFIPNSNKLLYLADNSLYTVNEDGTENVKISGELGIATSPIISEDGLFCYLTGNASNRITYYDIYKMNIQDESFDNLTVLDNDQIGDINYKQGFIVYISISNNDIYSLKKMNVNTSINYDTIYVASEESIILSPVFGQTTDDIFFTSLNGIYKINNYNQCELIIANEYGIRLFYPFEEILFFESTSHEILSFNLSNSVLNYFINGYFPDFSNDKMIYSTNWGDYNSEVRVFNLTTFEDTFLVEHAYKGKFSDNAQKITFIGKYITNPRSKNLITN
jgi:hypothetical protein